MWIALLAREFALTHPDRLLWPDVGLTKQGLAEFYADIADWVLPYLIGRPLSLVRCPSGTASKCFFQKHAWEGMAGSVKRRDIGALRAPLPRRRYRSRLC